MVDRRRECGGKREREQERDRESESKKREVLKERGASVTLFITLTEMESLGIQKGKLNLYKADRVFYA